MLFNSSEFIFCFLPVTIIGFYLLLRLGASNARYIWLTLCSLFFYGWWNPWYLVLIVMSMLFNYAVGWQLLRIRRYRRRLLIFGIAVNMASIGYFKYTCFFVSNVNRFVSDPWTIPEILLPLGISFFTFQQITYLIDSYRNQTREYNFVHYCLFVTFFPQLIAGPIVHHREMLPQFARNMHHGQLTRNLIVGMGMFTIGLFKKIALADNLSDVANPIFAQVHIGHDIDFVMGWLAALSYTFQLYFDFSGYSDMAVGLGFCFGIRLPANFNSPYKAQSIMEFWRRWHITLSRFLRDYLYIPLGGRHKCRILQFLSILVTMFLGGLWHGAGWTFVLWGILHGMYLCTNHGWHHFKRTIGITSTRRHSMWSFCARVLTFVSVSIGWVLFRSESLNDALAVLKGMAGLNGCQIPLVWVKNWPALAEHLDAGYWTRISRVKMSSDTPLIFWSFVICFLLPNTLQLFRMYRPYLDAPGYRIKQERPRWLLWKPNVAWAVILAYMLLYSIIRLNRVSEFLYFNF